MKIEMGDYFNENEDDGLLVCSVLEICNLQGF